MIILFLFGLGMLIFGCLMFAKPLSFSKGILRFSEKPWFHSFEVISRLALGLLLLTSTQHTSYPLFVFVLGILLGFTSIFLIIMGADWHRRFAVFTSEFNEKFRWLGVISIVGGFVLIYLSGMIQTYIIG